MMRVYVLGLIILLQLSRSGKFNRKLFVAILHGKLFSYVKAHFLAIVFLLHRKSTRQMVQKFNALRVRTNVYKSIQEMRIQGQVKDDEIESEKLERLNRECLWLDNLCMLSLV